MTRLLAALLTVFLVLHSGAAALAALASPGVSVAAVGHHEIGHPVVSKADDVRPDRLSGCCGRSMFHGHDGGHCLDDCGFFPQLADIAFARPAQTLSATAPGAATGGAGGGPYRPPIH